MNKIYNLLNEKFVIALFKKEILPQYPEFFDIKQIKISTIKNHIWETTYHIIFKFQVTFATNKQEDKIVFIYCTAHSNESRLNSYEASMLLWQNNFSKKNLNIPRPLFYSTYFNAFFYEGVIGKNFYHYIRQKNFVEIEALIIKTAAWLAKLHQLPTQNIKNFNTTNNRIETVTPGKIHFLKSILVSYPYYYEVCCQIYEIINNQEKNFLNNNKKRWLIHGDAHPENIINTGPNNIAFIDFVDFCLTDFARDLGAFLQQLEFMTLRKINDPIYTKKIQQLFLTTYFNITKKELDSNLQNRIDNYYNWTALRTATFFLLKAQPEPKRAHGLLVQICQNLKLRVNI
ncbi:MAG: phosphotransferase [Patescibacteria group bacterium]|nr:aminoglycoside phosphotransferase family protein [Patescibacteria group bacterium]MBU1870697.1 aminoglycoside phosphotransferase family protein [Patescibacteria group bacterium]